MKYTFRCKNCGHLHCAEHAGENQVPHACCVCGKGVQHGTDFQSIAEKLRKSGLSNEERKVLADEIANANSTLTKTYQSDNWEILSECDDKQLEEYGLKKENIEIHNPITIGKPDGKNIVANISENLKSKDKVK